MIHAIVTLQMLAQRAGERLREDQDGATAVEYGLMVALIAAVIIVAVVFLGQETSGTFDCTAQEVKARGTAGC